jgi:hypothetical protein
LSKKCPTQKALGSRAGLRKLVVSFGAMPCTRMQSSNVAASCLVKVAHRAAAKCGAAGLSNARAWPHDVRFPPKATIGRTCPATERPFIILLLATKDAFVTFRCLPHQVSGTKEGSMKKFSFALAALAAIAFAIPSIASAEDAKPMAKPMHHHHHHHHHAMKKMEKMDKKM